MSVTWTRISFEHIQQSKTFIILSCINVKLSFLFVLCIEHYMHSIRNCVKTIIDNICKEGPWVRSTEMNIISSVLAPKPNKYTISFLIFETWSQLVDI